MGQHQSKDELLYQQVNYGNVEGIKVLRRQGAGIEWIDREGKTPLILACTSAELFHVAKILIDLGANVNAYRPGRNAGTPLHHAARRGLDNTIKLLLGHGANTLLMNDDCQTPLEVARAKGFSRAVRTIESYICLFAGWLREFYGPSFLEALAPQLISRKIWVVVLPTGSHNPTKPFKLELAIYSSLQDAQPRTVIALWKANLEEMKLHQSDPSVIIVDKIIRTRIKLAPANESDRQQLQRFCDACKGVPQSAHPPAFLQSSCSPPPPIVQATAPPSSAEDLELAMAISASIQSAMTSQPQSSGSCSASSAEASSSATGNACSFAAAAAVAPGPTLPHHQPQPQPQPQPQQQATIPAIVDRMAAPPATDVENGLISYPEIDSSPLDMSVPLVAASSSISTGEKKEAAASSCCVICLDAPIEGAFIPCGHMVGCLPCLNEIKSKEWGCPICRAKIQLVVRLHAV